ncbi:NR2CA protein, partial [Sylvia borin]|nr:NR2CA protein [Sylvia borin]
RRVSSVLNRDVKHFGKQHLFDGSEETCWNSDQELEQLCERIKRIWEPLGAAGSQGRFWASTWRLLGAPGAALLPSPGCRTGEELVTISELYPQDSHAMQISFPGFQVEETVLEKLKITFGSSTDFFGRIVVYHLGVLGERL